MGRGSGDGFSSLQARAGRFPSGNRQEDFQEFYACELFCPRCQAPVPVRERLLLVLPDGELYEYLCGHCGTSIGEKTTKGKENIHIVVG